MTGYGSGLFGSDNYGGVMSGNYAAVQNRKTSNIRKGLQGSVFLAKYSAAAITTLTSPSDATAALSALPTGYADLGYLTGDGAQWSQNVDTSNITSWGEIEPTRTDVTSKTTTLKVAAQETNIGTVGMYIGADLSAVTPAHSGEVDIAEPINPNAPYYRVLCLAVDQTPNGELYIGRFMPRAQVTDIDDQAFADGDDPTLWGVTLTGFKDDTLGYAHKWLFAGPGWLAGLSAGGWPAAASS